MENRGRKGRKSASPPGTRFFSNRPSLSRPPQPISDIVSLKSRLCPLRTFRFLLCPRLFREFSPSLLLARSRTRLSLPLLSPSFLHAPRVRVLLCSSSCSLETCRQAPFGARAERGAFFFSSSSAATTLSLASLFRHFALLPRPPLPLPTTGDPASLEQALELTGNAGGDDSCNMPDSIGQNGTPREKKPLASFLFHQHSDAFRFAHHARQTRLSFAIRFKTTGSLPASVFSQHS